MDSKDNKIDFFKKTYEAFINADKLKNSKSKRKEYHNFMADYHNKLSVIQSLKWSKEFNEYVHNRLKEEL